MSLVNSIVAGDKVTIRDRFGKRRTGRAVMRGTYGWVLNMGGAHGTPGIADHDNTVDVRSSTGKAKYTGSNPGDHIVYERGWATVVEDRGLYTVIRNTTTYGYPDSSYKKDADGLSLAKARCDYLFKTNGNKPFSGLRRSQSSTRKDGRNPGHDAVIYIRRQRKWNPSSKRMAWMYTAHGAGGYGSAYMGEDVSLAKLKRQLKILYPKADVVWQGTSKLISRGNPRGKRGGFKRLVRKLKRRGARTPKALAAWIERRKYGKKKFAKMSTAGRKRAATRKKSRRTRR